jgi:hypothetical protein
VSAGRGAAVLAALLVACGGTDQATIGGSLSGLGTGLTLTLQDNGSDSLTLTGNGSFAFASRVSEDGVYAVTVLTQPVGEDCLVVNGSGSVDNSGDSIDTVAVTCVATASIVGSVSGLVPGTAVTLSDGGVLLPVATNGPFAFPGTVLPGTAYDVSVATQPLGETCTVSNGSGTVGVGGTTQVIVTCS